MMRNLHYCCPLIFAVACGATTPAPESTAPSPASSSSPKEVGSTHEPPSTAQSNVEAEPQKNQRKEQPQPPELLPLMPPECQDDKSCVPPPEFTEKACQGRYPGMAVAMFEKSTPWQRLYLKAAQLEAVNSYGGRATSAPMVYGEEVIVLRDGKSQDSSQMQVSGATDIDLLRWDGTCVTARREMFETYRMPQVQNATITWRYLDENIREALLEAKYVKIMRERQEDACKGSRASSPTPTCKKATDKLNDAITVAVRGGIELPVPENLPLWATPEDAVARSEQVSREQADSR